MVSRSRNIMKAVSIEEILEWEHILEKYLAYLKGCGRAKNTIHFYEDHVSRFYKSQTPRWDDEKEAFLAWNGESQIHTNHRLDACKRFWDWGISEGYRRNNPAATVAKRIIDKRPIVNISLGDIEKVVRAFQSEYKSKPAQWERIRNYAYLLFSIGTGIRPGEGLHIRRFDFNLREGYAVVRGESVKTRQSRIVYIPQHKGLLRLLQKMIKIQVQSGLPLESPLFSDSSGKRINTRSWFHIVDKRAKNLGIRIKPYDFRHAFITHSLMNGANPYDIRDQVGHSNMEMMKRYYHSNPEARLNTANLAPLQRISTN